MTENDYIEELKKRWPRRGDATIETINFADEATRAAVELIHNLACFLFAGQNPYSDDKLRKKAKG